MCNFLLKNDLLHNFTFLFEVYVRLSFSWGPKKWSGLRHKNSQRGEKNDIFFFFFCHTSSCRDKTCLFLSLIQIISTVQRFHGEQHSVAINKQLTELTSTADE